MRCISGCCYLSEVITHLKQHDSSIKLDAIRNWNANDVSCEYCESIIMRSPNKWCVLLSLNRLHTAYMHSVYRSRVQNACNHCASLNGNWIQIASIKLMNEEKKIAATHTCIQKKTNEETNRKINILIHTVIHCMWYER